MKTKKKKLTPSELGALGGNALVKKLGKKSKKYFSELAKKSNLVQAKKRKKNAQ